ncbi:phage baseplate plug family protein [Solilutibacter silvestris]|uniref:phage baseplate plug family protein n=1 Tax=Solilutibacter silvestris TaxID=1645665 RepID=UPI003D353112
MAVYEIPLTGVSQNLTVTLAGVAYQFTVTWRDYVSTYFLDIADGSGNTLVTGIALVPGSNLIGQFKPIGFGGMLKVVTPAGNAFPPNFGDFGSVAHLMFVTP